MIPDVRGNGPLNYTHRDDYTPSVYRVFSPDVTAAILMSQNDETAAMMVSQTSPVGVEFISYANAFFCFNKFACMLATCPKTLYNIRPLSSFKDKDRQLTGGKYATEIKTCDNDLLTN